MAYNNRGGWNNGYGGGPNRGGYNNGPRYNNSGWGDRNDRYNNRNTAEPQQTNFEFELGQPVRHIATGLKLSVISFGREQIECRTPDLRSEYFYPHELEPWTED